MTGDPTNGDRLALNRRVWFPQREALVPSDTLDAFRVASIAVGTQRAQIGEWLVQGVPGKIVVVERSTKLNECLRQVHSPILVGDDRLGLVVGSGDHGRDAGKDQDFVATAPGSPGAPPGMSSEKAEPPRGSRDR